MHLKTKPKVNEVKANIKKRNNCTLITGEFSTTFLIMARIMRLSANVFITKDI